MNKRLTSCSHWVPVFLVLIFTGLIAGCASNLSGETYSRGEARKTQTVEYGTIEDFRYVQIEGDRGGLSKFGGGVVGGIAGSGLGDGTGRQLTTALGAIAGAVVGGEVEERASRAQGVDLTVRMASGRLISVVQEIPDTAQNPYQIGQKVRVQRVDGQVRVVPVSSYQ